MTDDRRFENGRWWQWDGQQWHLEPEHSATPSMAPKPSVDERAAYSQDRRAALIDEEKRRRARGRPARVLGWVLVASGVGFLVLGFLDLVDQTNRAARPTAIEPDPTYGTGFAVIAGFLILIGVIVVVGNRRRA